jgi:hypothetical protein
MQMAEQTIAARLRDEWTAIQNAGQVSGPVQSGRYLNGKDNPAKMASRSLGGLPVGQRIALAVNAAPEPTRKASRSTDYRLLSGLARTLARRCMRTETA